MSAFPDSTYSPAARTCLAEQAKILCDEAEANNLDMVQRWPRWYTCSLCEQQYYGVVRCALGWACWKTYVGRPEADVDRRFAFTELGNGLYEANRFAEALTVGEAELSTTRRLDASEGALLILQGNLASTYQRLGRLEETLRLKRDVYSGWMKLNGDQHEETLSAANNYAASLLDLKRFEEAKALLRKTIPVARRVLGEGDRITLTIRKIYAEALYADPAATLDDVREAVRTLEELERTARRVFGGAHPLTTWTERRLREARAALRAREAPPSSSGGA